MHVLLCGLFIIFKMILGFLRKHFFSAKLRFKTKKMTDGRNEKKNKIIKK